MPSLQDILRIAASAFPEAGVGVLLVGGFAVNHYGYTRNTLDIDFMAAEGEQDRIREVMIREGFTNRSEMENVVLYQHPEGGMRVDILSVDAATMQRLLANAQSVQIGEFSLAVPALRDLIAMKLFAISTGSSARLDKDLPDVTYLTVLNDLDLEEDIKPLCRRFAADGVYREIERRVKALQGS